jgi:predicted DNA-binding transcriptional regulator YafY
MTPRDNSRGEHSAQRQSTAKKMTKLKPSTAKGKVLDRPHPSARGAVGAGSKVQRWIDLLASLLGRHYPATLDEIARDVPAYVRPGLAKEAIRRMFERDKSDLRGLGVNIETIPLEEGESIAYRLLARDFYLPYLTLAMPRGRSRAASQRVGRYGYRALPAVLFEPEELRFLAEAGQRVAAIGDADLATAAANALRKLRYDLTNVASIEPSEHIIQPRTWPDLGVMRALTDALRARKRAEIEYHTMGSDTRTRRTIEPYGLFLVSGHWYLAARDVDKENVRTFRVSRIGSPRPNARRPRTPDYEIAPSFSLREHARSRKAWDIGDGDTLEAVVEFVGETGALTAAAPRGEPGPGVAAPRAMKVRPLAT